MIYLQLFFSFVIVGLFSIGGGSASMPIIESQVVDLHHWITLEKFGEVITISVLPPGSIAINTATFVGTQIGGFWGAVMATLGFITPSIMILFVLAFLYQRLQNNRFFQGALCGMNYAVAALVSVAGFTMAKLSFLNSFIDGVNWNNLTAISIFLLSFIALRKWKPNPIFIILGSGVIGVLTLGLLYPMLNK